jgi:hypothetical protein
MLGRTNVIHKYIPPNNRLRAGVFDLVMSSWFDQLVMAVILVNVATMALNHEGQSSTWEEAISWANVAFTVVFVMEAALKLVAIGVTKYFKVRACTMHSSHHARVMQQRIGALSCACHATAGSTASRVTCTSCCRLEHGA